MGGSRGYKSFGATNRSEFSRGSAWWAFNYVTNWATLNYQLMSRDIREEQQDIEKSELARQEATEKHALELLTTGDEAACRQYLTDYSVANGAGVIGTWWNLSDRLVVKYSNQMVHDAATGKDEFPGYPDWWLDEAGYQYGPRVYEFEALQHQSGQLAYTNATIIAPPHEELSAIQESQHR